MGDRFDPCLGFRKSGGDPYLLGHDGDLPIWARPRRGRLVNHGVRRLKKLRSRLRNETGCLPPTYSLPQSSGER